MNPIQRIVGRLTELLTTSTNVLSQQIRIVTRRFRSSFHNPTHSFARPNYDWWRRAYYCRVRGLELSGLFLKPLVNKLAAWTLGRPPKFKLDSQANSDALTTWWAEQHVHVLRAMRGALRQGDSFLVVNADLSITLLPPGCVDPIVDDRDYATIIGWRVTQVMAHPDRVSDRMTVIDEYYADRRIHRVEVNATLREEQVFPNLLGRIPLIHIPNQPDEGEIFGHAEAEALVELLHRYGVVLEVAVEGNELMGRPTPVVTFANQPELDAWWERESSRHTRTLPDGTSEAADTVAWNPQAIVATTGGFTWQSPGSFAEDTEKLLGLMFYLFLEHAEIPEFVMGNAISSSKASAETQLPVFVKFIEMRQGEVGGWIKQIAEVVLGYLSLTTPGVTVETPTLQWESLSGSDGTLTLATITWALAEGLLDEKTALMLAPIDVDDPDAVLAQAKEEREARMALVPGQGDEPQFDADLEAEINDLEI